MHFSSDKIRFCFEWMCHISVAWMEFVVAVAIVVVVVVGGGGGGGDSGSAVVSVGL